MSDSVRFTTFPTGEVSALAYLYVQNQDLKGKTPEDVYTMYAEAKAKIDPVYKERKKMDTSKANIIPGGI